MKDLYIFILMLIFSVGGSIIVMRIIDWWENKYMGGKNARSSS